MVKLLVAFLVMAEPFSSSGVRRSLEVTLTGDRQRMTLCGGLGEEDPLLSPGRGEVVVEDTCETL